MRKILLIAVLTFGLGGCAALDVLGGLFATPQTPGVEEITPRTKYQLASAAFDGVNTAINRLVEIGVIPIERLRNEIKPVQDATDAILDAWQEQLLAAGKDRDAGLLNRADGIEASANAFYEPGVRSNVEFLGTIVQAGDQPKEE